jgi:DNA adenine methylase
LCGGLAVTLGLMPIRALLNDVNIHAINFLQRLKGGLAITIPLENNQRLHYQHRKRFNELISCAKAKSKEAAEISYYLNRTCYQELSFQSLRRIQRSFSAIQED